MIDAGCFFKSTQIVMATQTPMDLFFDQMRDLHSVELQLSRSVPGLAAKAENPELRAQLSRQATETHDRFEKLNRIFRKHGVSPGQDVCKAMQGLIEGGDEHLEQVDVPATRDLMLVAHCLRIEHYGIAAYTITARLAGQLQLQEEAAALQQIVAERQHTAELLLKLESGLFLHAQGRLAA